MTNNSESLNRRHSTAAFMRLQGRLGNQLFQLALALNISQKYGVQVLLEDYVATSKGFERFLFKELAVFDYFQYCSQLDALMVRALHHPMTRKFYCPDNLFIEGESGDGEMVLAQPYKFYTGFFQSPELFPDKNILLKAFSLKDEFICEPLSKLLHLTGETECLAVSVRRGDFVGLPHLGVCSDAYYLEAITLIQARRPVDHIFIFSDDINYCREMFASLKCQVVFVEGFTPAKALYLMSRCHHLVIANSTFSWWGAWLSDYQDKLVICPSPWNDSTAVASDFIPSDWIRLSKQHNLTVSL
jgi:hypothetical protein